MFAKLQLVIAGIGLAFFGLAFLALLAYKFWGIAKRELERVVPATTPVAWKVLLGVAFCAVWQYGATKEGGITWGTISFPAVDVEQRYLYDAGSSLNTNSVHLAFYYLIAPASADFNVARRPVGNNDPAAWELVYTNTLGGVVSPLDLEFTGAYTNNWAVFTSWTPGPAVHTNGVWQIDWRSVREGSTLIPIHTKVYNDGVLVMPATGGNNAD